MSVSPVCLLADSRLLFSRRADGQPILKSICQQSSKRELHAAYIGAANGDDRVFYSIFEAAMDLVGIRDRRMIMSAYSREDRDYLQHAEVVLIAGGKAIVGWRVMQRTGMHQDLRERHGEAAPLIGVSAGAMLLGATAWSGDDSEADALCEALDVVPYVVDAHDESHGWRRLANVVASATPQRRGIGLPAGGGLILHANLSLEPIGRGVTEFLVRGDQLMQRLLLPHEG